MSPQDLCQKNLDTTIFFFFSQVSNPPFGESLLDCSLKGLKEHKPIGRCNDCQLFSG